MTTTDSNTEIWKPVHLVKWKHLYEVSSTGNVRRIAGTSHLKIVRLLTPRTRRGETWLYVDLFKGKYHNRVRVSTLVAQAFLGCPKDEDGLFYKDGNYRNCAADNLYYRAVAIPHDKCAVCLNKLTEAEIAYFAGILDGEGHMAIVYHKGGKHPYHDARIIISNTDEGLMQWLRHRFGGFVRAVKTPHRPIYTWTHQSIAGASLLEHALPFLVIKRQQATVFIEFRLDKYARTLRFGRKELDAATYKHRESQRTALRQAVLSYNRTGANAFHRKNFEDVTG